MGKPVGCAVYTKQDPTSGWAVEAHHYENLRDRMDRNETGWIELDSVFGDGKIMLRLEDIVTLVNCTPSYCRAIDAEIVTE